MIDAEFEGYAIPKGTQIAVSPVLVHNDPKYYDNPHEFRPERWLEDPYAHPSYIVPVFNNDYSEKVVMLEESRLFVPFGHGPHRCSGERFAMQTMTLVCLDMNLGNDILQTISYVFGNYRLELVDAPPDKPWPIPTPDYRKAVGMPTPMTDLMVRVKRL